MKKLILILVLFFGVIASSVSATAVNKTIQSRQAQAIEMQKKIKQMEQDALNRKVQPPKQKNVQKKQTKKTKAVKKVKKQAENKKESKKTSQATDKTDFLHITGPGDFAGPLMQQQIAQDGSSGLAYQKPDLEEKPSDVPEDNPPLETKRLKAVEKEYTLSGTTFDVELNKSVQVPANASFQHSTMEQAIRDVKKESMQYVECQQGDKNCAEYKVDATGKVILE